MVNVDVRSAVFAFAFQQQITDDRDIQIEWQRPAACSAMGLGQDNGLILGQAVYYDIEKAAETCSQNNYEQ